MADRTYGGGTPKTSEEEFWDGEIPWFQSADLAEHEVQFAIPKKGITELGLKKSAAQLIPSDSIAIVTRVGVGKLAFMPFPYTTSQDFLSLSELKIDGEFGCYAIYKLLQREKNLTQGTSIKGITKEELLNKSIEVPIQEEQAIIGRYFSNLDNLITLHQRKLFYKASKIIVWEQRKLGDQMYIKSRIGWQRLTKDEYQTEGDYYLITGTDINEVTHTIDLNRSYYVSKERYEKDLNIQVIEGDIIVTKDGTIGKVAMVCGLDKPATLNSHLFVLRDLSGKLNNRFLLHILDSPIFEKFVETTKTGSTLTGIPQKTMVEFEFKVPSVEEQKKISCHFDNLDTLITLHRRTYYH